MDADENNLYMRDVPMPEADRELLEGEFEGFNSMTYEEWKKISKQKLDEILDTINDLSDYIENEVKKKG